MTSALARPGCCETEYQALPPLLRRGELLAQGFTDNHIRRWRREGALVAIAQGNYLSTLEWQELDDRGRYRLLVRTILAGLTGDPVVSHRSAAVVHGIADVPVPFSLKQPGTVDIIRGGPTKSRHGPVLRVHRAVLGPDEIVRRDELAVTSLARTVVDCSLTMPVVEAATLAGGVLAAGRLTTSDLELQLRQERTPRSRVATAQFAAVITTALGLPPEDCDSHS